MPAASATAQDQAGPDAALVDWARAHAMPSDSAFAFLRGLVGRARILALGEPVHGGHEPLAFRNRLIAHAVERLGFTAVALESGLTESMLADDFIQGRGGDIDSVTRYGLTWSFQYLPENRALLGAGPATNSFRVKSNLMRCRCLVASPNGPWKDSLAWNVVSPALLVSCSMSMSAAGIAIPLAVSTHRATSARDDTIAALS